jgi:hypothetical protein
VRRVARQARVAHRHVLADRFGQAQRVRAFPLQPHVERGKRAVREPYLERPGDRAELVAAARTCSTSAAAT